MNVQCTRSSVRVFICVNALHGNQFSFVSCLNCAKVVPVALLCSCVHTSLTCRNNASV